MFDGSLKQSGGGSSPGLAMAHTLTPTKTTTRMTTMAFVLFDHFSFFGGGSSCHRAVSKRLKSAAVSADDFAFALLSEKSALSRGFVSASGADRLRASGAAR